jgi:hypothetical protein
MEIFLQTGLDGANRIDPVQQNRSERARQVSPKSAREGAARAPDASASITQVAPSAVNQDFRNRPAAAIDRSGQVAMPICDALDMGSCT